MQLSKAKLQYLRGLAQKKIREKENKFLLEGARAISEALLSKAIVEMVVATSAAQRNYQKVIEIAIEKKIPVYTISENDVSIITKTVHTQGILAVVNQLNYTINDVPLDHGSMIVACDSITDPGNLGTLIRSCDWFGVNAVVLSRGSVSLYNEKVIRSTAGSIFHLPVIEHVDLMSLFDMLKKQGWFVVATTLKGTLVNSKFKFPSKTILVFGNEAHGISQQLQRVADESVTIPSFGRAESLNVHTACCSLLTAWRLLNNYNSV